MVTMMKRKHQRNQKKTSSRTSDPRVLPFHGHIQELRQRLTYIVGSIVIFTGLGFVIREQLIDILVSPAQTQQFIYTSPVGGFDFIFRVSLYFGLACSVPILMYNVFQFFSPLLPNRSGRFVLKATIFSFLLATFGILFGYFASLPAALNFLLNQFGTNQIEALLSIQEYMSFVMIYLVGFALLFQIPLLLLFINRITPLKPQKLMSSQRYVIVGATILAAILTPTADVINLLIMAVPIIVMYQIGVVLVLVKNRRRRKQETALTVKKSRQSQVAAPTTKLSQPYASSQKPRPPKPRPHYVPLNSPNVIQ